MLTRGEISCIDKEGRGERRGGPWLNGINRSR